MGKSIAGSGRRRRIGGISGGPQGSASGDRRKSDCNKSAMGCSFGRSLPAIDITQYTRIRHNWGESEVALDLRSLAQLEFLDNFHVLFFAAMFCSLILGLAMGLQLQWMIWWAIHWCFTLHYPHNNIQPPKKGRYWKNRMYVAKYTEDPRLQTGYSFVPEMTSEERRASLNLCGPHVMDFIVPLASSMASVFGETKTRFNRRYIYI